MNQDILSQFLMSVAENPRILASHISLFSAILCFKKSDDNVFNVSRNKLMTLSKVRSTATYHKCLSELIDFGYLKYIPSYNPQIGSEIQIDASVSAQKVNQNKNLF